MTPSVEKTLEVERARLLTVTLCFGHEMREVASLVFLPGSDRAYTVGSSPQADVQIPDPQIPPVAFYLEHDESGVILSPLYVFPGFRVNGGAVAGSVRLPMRAQVEIGAGRIGIMVGSGPVAGTGEVTQAWPIETPEVNETVMVQALQVPAAAAQSSVGASHFEGEEGQHTLIERPPSFHGTASKASRPLLEPSPVRSRPIRVRLRALIRRLRRSVLMLCAVAITMASATLSYGLFASLGPAERTPEPTPAPSVAGVEKAPEHAATAERQTPKVDGKPVETASERTVSKPAPTEAEAVNHLAAGRLREALAAYESLAIRNPDVDAYPVVLRSLRQRLRTDCTCPLPAADPQGGSL